MDIFLNILQFIVGVVVIFGGGYWLLTRFVPEVALQIKTTIVGVIAKFKKG